MKNNLKTKFKEFFILMRSIPSIVVSLFVVSIVAMNLLANKSINMPTSYLALDAGILLSWVSFLTMDIVTKHFGYKAANKLAIFGIFVNLCLCLVFLIAGIIDGVWGESFVEGSENVINTAINNTFKGTWYVLFGSSVAFLISSLVNNFTNHLIGKHLKKDSFASFSIRTYISTAIGQFIDNLTFALIVSHFFFNWSIVQCVVCALTGAIVELLFEVIFSPIGYKISKKWKEDNVGKEYFEFINNERN